jgi:hypothetical protein
MFGMDIFWKAAVHPWKSNKSTPFVLLEEHDQIRRWMLGEMPFPRCMALMVTVSTPKRAQLAFNPPVEICENELRVYQFHAL